MSAAVTIFATLLLAPPGTVMDRVLVSRCPNGCGFAHLHYVARDADLTTLVRRPRCDPSRPYRLLIGDVLPAQEVRHAAA